MTDGAGAPDGVVRKIIHVDLDAFFASVEQRDDPALRGRPVAVGGDGPRGVVAAASYEARKFGVRSAMPSVRARNLCPELVFVPPRFDAYREASAQVREIFHRYSAAVEPLSLDEAYLDVTVNLAGLATATEVAEAIRKEIREATGLTASAGVSYNKFLAKMASDLRKPDGLFVIRPSQGEEFVAGLPVGRFHGVGPSTEAKMHALGILTGVDLKERELSELKQRFGKVGEHYFWIARGVDRRPVVTDSPRKSVGAENTFEGDLMEFQALVGELRPIAAKAWSRVRSSGFSGRTVTLKVKFSDFTQVTRSRTLGAEPETEGDLLGTAVSLLEDLLPTDKGIRLLGVTLSGSPDRGRAAQPGTQLSLDL